MRVPLIALATATVVIGCASASSASKTDVRPPLAARLGPGAKTGDPIPLRFDPTMKVVISKAANLPAAPYSDAQAARGEKVYDNTCATCHQADNLVGAQFVQNWNDRRVGDFHSLVRATMPVDNPGGLTDQQYLDVVAYILKANHAAPSMDSLSADTTIMRGRKISVRNP
jgi:mono/diheme cytochrome c family protein